MGPQGHNSDRVADLELQLRAQERYTATQGRAAAPLDSLLIKNAISAKAPDASPGDSFTATARPWIIFTNGDETPRREKPVIRAQTRDGSKIEEEDQKLTVYFYGGRWWIVTPGSGQPLVFLGDPASSDVYVTPNADDLYDARLVTVSSVGAPVQADPEKKIWLIIGQKYVGDTIQPLPRGLVLLGSKQGEVTFGEGEAADTRPLYYADHYQWLYVKLDLSGDADKLDDGEIGNVIVLDKDETETAVTLNVRNRSGGSVPNHAKVFVDHHAESGEWWIRHYSEPSAIARAKVYDASIDNGATGEITLFECGDPGAYAETSTPAYNATRPVFKDEELVVGRDACRDYLILNTPAHTLEGTAAEDIAKGDSGNVTLTGLTDTPTISAESKLGSVANGDIVYVVWQGGWRIIAAECPEGG